MALWGGVLLSGCAAGGPPPTTYDLSLSNDVAAVRGRTSAQLLVREPRALRALDTERIVIRPQLQEITYLGGAQLADRLPLVVQARLIEAFERSAGARAVAAPGDGLVIDYTLSSHLRRFDVRVFRGDGNSDVDDATDHTRGHTPGRDFAEIEIFVNLLNERNGRVLASKLFQASAPTSANSADAVASALNTAFSLIARDIVAWTYAEI